MTVTGYVPGSTYSEVIIVRLISLGTCAVVPSKNAPAPNGSPAELRLTSPSYPFRDPRLIVNMALSNCCIATCNGSVVKPNP
jgi:hypothetical protein